MIFSFSLHAITHRVILVAYFERELSELRKVRTTRRWQGVSLLILEISTSFVPFSG